MGGREGGMKGGCEGWREGGREGGKDGVREGGGWDPVKCPTPQLLDVVILTRTARRTLQQSRNCQPSRSELSSTPKMGRCFLEDIFA